MSIAKDTVWECIQDRGTRVNRTSKLRRLENREADREMRAYLGRTGNAGE